MYKTLFVYKKIEDIQVDDIFTVTFYASADKRKIIYKRFEQVKSINIKNKSFEAKWIKDIYLSADLWKYDNTKQKWNIDYDKYNYEFEKIGDANTYPEYFI